MDNYDNPYYVSELNINEIHQLGYTGKEIKIAVLDSGADFNHVELTNKIFYGKNFTTDNDNNKFNYYDKNGGHGTGVVGEIIKIAPDAKVIVVKVMCGNGGSMADIIKGIDFAIKQNVDIISMSIGTAKHDSDLEAVIRKAVENNICVVAAVGNDGQNEDDIDEIYYPAYYEPTIAVGSLTKDYKPSYFTDSNDLIDLLTFGEEIQSIYPNNKYASASGTSQACPIVSATLCLMKQFLRDKLGKEPSENEIYEYLIQNTKEIEGVSRKLQGHGYLELSNLIEDIKSFKNN